MSESMTVAFAEAYDAIRTVLSRAVRDDALTRHRAGVLLCEVKAAGNTYGTKAIERMADKLGMSTTLLYQYILVAETWSTAELQELLARTNQFGEPLSWSHLAILPYVVGRVERAKIIDRCLAEGWGARELGRQMAAHGKAAAAAKIQTVDDGEAVRIALLDGMQSASRAALHLGIFVEALESRLLDGSADEVLVERTIGALEKLRQQLEIAFTCLRKAPRESGSHVKVAAAAPRAVRTRSAQPRR
jgi:hypothetical protein